MSTTNIYGLIGKTLAHSFSQRFFKEKFKQEEIHARYENFELENIEEVQFLLKRRDIRGLNVTIPYKESVMNYLDEISSEAQAIGAVNTIVFNDGKTVGHNTDAYGFRQSIKPFLRNVHDRAIILGTGGAAKAIAYVLENIGVEVIYLSRAPKSEQEFSYTEANEFMINSRKLIVNCTPIGTFPNVDDVPPIPLNSFTQDHLVVDLIYNPEKTRLLKHAEKSGTDILNGYSMLKHQALKSWELWNNNNSLLS